MPEVHPAQEKRDESRVDESKAVVIEMGGGTHRHIGLITNISPSGARIRIADAHNLAEDIRLTSPVIGNDVAATIHWRKKNEIGVRFAEPLSAS